MDESTLAVERVIQRMYENLGGRLCIDDMARTAIFSKFHFSRVFHQVTGLSPGRFLSAIRLQAAKRLLCSTSLSVTDICFEVGYNSVGTFSSRFKATVGVSPSLYRQRCGLVSRLRVSRRSDWGTSSTLVEGEVWLPDMNVGSIFVGAFPEPIMQGLPIRYHVLHQPGPYALDDLPRGTWHILATASFPGEEGSVRDPVHDDPPPVVAACGPVVVGHPGAQLSADLHLRPMRITDPPVLLALPDVRWSYEPAEDLAEDLIEHSA